MSISYKIIRTTGRSHSRLTGKRERDYDYVVTRNVLVVNIFGTLAEAQKYIADRNGTLEDYEK